MNPIIVERYPADRQGPDISDPLITTEPVAVARGLAEIDRACSDRVIVSGTGPVQDFIAPGSIVEIADAEEGPYRAMITDFAITIDRRRDQLTAQASIKAERVA